MVTDKDLEDAGLVDDEKPVTPVNANNPELVIIGSGNSQPAGSANDEIERSEEEEQKELTDPAFRRMFPCQVRWKGVRLWTLYFAAWAFGLGLLTAIVAVISIFVLSEYINPLLPIFLIDLVYIAAFAVDMYKNRLDPVRVGERVMSDMWGELSDKVSSGLTFRLKGEKFWRIPTGIRQVEFGVLGFDKDGLPVAGPGSIGILTNESEEESEGQAQEEIKGNQAVSGAKKTVSKIKKSPDGMVLGWMLVLNFRYPFRNDDLKIFIRNAPLPEDPSDIDTLEENIKGLIDEPMKDIARSVDQIEGYPWSYKKIMRERVKFDQGINKLFKQHEKVIRFVNQLRLRDMSPSGKHTELPAALKEALNAKVAARPKGEAQKIEAIEVGKGQAEVIYLVRKRVIDLWNEPTSNINDRNVAFELERFKTYVDSMKPGDKFVVSPNIISGFGQLAGGPSPEQTFGMKKEDLESFIGPILEQLIAKKLSQKQMPKYRR